MRGIMFLPEMYAASEARVKCMTSRMGGLDLMNEYPDLMKLATIEDGVFFFEFNNIKALPLFIVSPRYKIGEILYVKEPYADDLNYPGVFYADDIFYLGPFRLKNKMFMPANHARRWIRITGIECKRVQDMTDQDYADEGIQSVPIGANWSQ